MYTSQEKTKRKKPKTQSFNGKSPWLESTIQGQRKIGKRKTEGKEVRALRNKTGRRIILSMRSELSKLEPKFDTFTLYL